MTKYQVWNITSSKYSGALFLSLQVTLKWPQVSIWVKILQKKEWRTTVKTKKKVGQKDPFLFEPVRNKLLLYFLHKLFFLQAMRRYVKTWCYPGRGSRELLMMAGVRGG